MARRLNPQHDARTREKIKTSQLVNRLQGFALGEKEARGGKPIEMSSVQVTAALGLLKKVLPDLESIEANVNAEVKQHVVSAEPISEDDWASEYGSGLETAGRPAKGTD